MTKRVLLILLFIAGFIAAQPVSVSFQVDMSVQEGYGLFNPAEHEVYLRGEFNDWGLNFPMTDDDSDMIYTFTIEGLMPADTFKYKYYNSRNETWESDPERVLIVPAVDDTLELHYFDRQDGSVASGDVNIFFSVNMEIEKVAGRFDPATETVWARGDFNGWSDTNPLTPSLSNQNIYEGFVQMFLFEGDTIHYKYAYGTTDDVTWENDFTQNSGGHRLIGITADDINAGFKTDEGTFNELSFDNMTAYESSVIFTVDMNNATDLNGSAFSAIENVFVCGGTYPLGWGWNQDEYDNATFMNDNGEEGDATAGDGIWSVRVIFPQYTSFLVQYKYGANWGLPSNNGTNDNENGVGEDHWILLEHNLVSATVNNVFGESTPSDQPHPFEDVVTDVNENNSAAVTDYRLEQNYPNPFNPSTKISYTIPDAGFVTLKVYDVLGKEVAVLVNGEKAAGTYSVNFDATGFSTGVYFYEIHAGNFSTYRKMLLLK